MICSVLESEFQSRRDRSCIPQLLHLYGRRIQLGTRGTIGYGYVFYVVRPFRFSEVPAELETRIRSVYDKDALTQMTRNAAACRDLEMFRDSLA